MAVEQWCLAKPCQYRQEIKKSIFLAQAILVQSKEEMEERVSQFSSATATHNCWAGRIGEFFRAYDDGEPSGTAGRPILQVIDMQKIDKVVLVVSRWFGGIKLGAGGLVRAYANTAAQCLAQAEKTLVVEHVMFRFSCVFSLQGRIRFVLQKYGAEVTLENFLPDSVEFNITVPLNRSSSLVQDIQDITRGQSGIAEIK